MSARTKITEILWFPQNLGPPNQRTRKGDRIRACHDDVCFRMKPGTGYRASVSPATLTVVRALPHFVVASYGRGCPTVVVKSWINLSRRK